MKLLILGGSSSRNSGGVYDTARMMGLRLHQQNNINVEYLFFDDEYSSEDKPHYAPLPVHSYNVKGPKKIGISTDLYGKIITIRPDVVHTQSLWMYLSWANKKYHGRTGTPYIVSPHGMLDKWQLNQSFWKNLKKNIALGLYERKHLEGSACLHALCREEHDAIRSFGLRNPIAIIPNGIDLHEVNSGSADITENHNGKKKLLFLGRIHVKKGLDNLLTAWSLMPKDHDWELVVAGETKDIAYQQSLLQRVNELQIADTVSFIGGQYGKAKLNCFRNSAAFILPSFSEGLPMSILEAWSHQLPVVMTAECNLPEGFAQQAAIPISTDPDSICKGIRQMIAMDTNRRIKMGQNGLALVKEKFSWGRVADSMTELYQWVTGQAPKPGFVFCN